MYERVDTTAVEQHKDMMALSLLSGPFGEQHVLCRIRENSAPDRNERNFDYSLLGLFTIGTETPPLLPRPARAYTLFRASPGLHLRNP